MNTKKLRRFVSRPFGRELSCRKSNCWRTRHQNSDEGFTLVELLIVVCVVPLIVGALSVGLISILSLQSSVSNRLANTADSQVVSASYQNDVQAAAYVTTDATSTPQCGTGTGTQLLGLESDLLQKYGVFQTIISYVSVVNAGATPPTYTLERLVCSQNSSSVVSAPSSTTILSYNLPSSQPVPTISCVSSASSLLCSQSLASQQFISAQNIADVTFTVAQPEPGQQNKSPSCATNKYCYSLVASPVASASSTNTGSPFSANTTTNCGFASLDTGKYSGTLCFVNFSFLNSPAALAQATGGGCLELSVSLPGNYTMYFCLQISGPTLLPWYLPTYPEAFLGNINNVSGVSVPFYTGIAGDPALYQRVSGQTDYVDITNISVVSPSGALATGWEAVSADAESTDLGESITWTSNVTMSDIPNGESAGPVGNACMGNTGVGGGGLTGNGTTTMACSGGTTETGSTKTGTAMIAAVSPNWMNVQLSGGTNGLEAITFGLLVP